MFLWIYNEVASTVGKLAFYLSIYDYWGPVSALDLDLNLDR